MKHRKLMPLVTCEKPDCGKAMYFLHATSTQMVYGCTNGHIRKVARPDGKKISIQWNGNPPNSAA